MREHLKLLIGLCLSSFLTSFMGSSLNVAMPFIAQDYNCSPENVTWMINAFTATSAAFLLASSALANRFGYLKIFLVGAAISAVLSVGVALSPDLLSGSIIRALQGISLSLIFCTAMALISQRIPREHRAFAIAYNIASVYAGLSFSPIVAGLIVDTLGWQTMFYLTAVGLAVSFFLCKSEKYDEPITDKMPLGRMSLSFVIGLLILFSVSGYTTNNLLLICLIIGVVLLCAYLVFEYKSDEPLLPVKFILSNNVLKYALFASLFHYFSSFVFTLLVAMHLQLVVGYNAATTGFILVLQPVLMVVFSSVSGKLAHVIGPQWLTIIGMTLCVTGIVTLYGLNEHSSLTIIFVAQALLGTGFGLFSAPNTIIVMASVQPKQYAMASAVQSISRTVGQAVSMATLTALLHYTIAVHQDSELYAHELSGSIHISFIISTGGYVIGLIFCFLCFVNRLKQVRARKAAEAAAAATSSPAAPAAPAATATAATTATATTAAAADNSATANSSKE